MEMLISVIKHMKNDKDPKNQFDSTEIITAVIDYGTVEQKNMVNID